MKGFVHVLSNTGPGPIEQRWQLWPRSRLKAGVPLVLAWAGLLAVFKAEGEPLLAFSPHGGGLLAQIRATRGVDRTVCSSAPASGSSPQPAAHQAARQQGSEAAKQSRRQAASGPHTRSSSWQLGELAAKN